MRRLYALLACVVLPCLLWAALPLTSAGAPPKARVAKLQKKLDITRGKIGRRKGTERVLSSEVAVYSRKINRLQTKITRLDTRQARFQADLDAIQLADRGVFTLSASAARLNIASARG